MNVSIAGKLIINLIFECVKELSRDSVEHLSVAEVERSEESNVIKLIYMQEVSLKWINWSIIDMIIPYPLQWLLQDSRPAN